MIEVARVLMHLSRFSVAVPFLFMMINKKRIKRRYFTWLGLSILISFAADILSMIAITSHAQYLTAYFINIQDIFQFILLLLIYHEFYLREKKAIVILATVVYFGFEIVNSLFLQKLGDQQTWSWTLSAIILLSFSIGYFEHLLTKYPLINPLKFAPGWINIAVFYYFGFSLYLFIMAEYVFKNSIHDAAFIFWGFHNFNNILKNCLFAVGISFAGNSDSSTIS